MADKTLQSYLDWFTRYVRSYTDRATENLHLMERKERHTMRVLAHVRQIAKDSGVSEELREIMEIATLLHDVGRFPQLVATNAYDDRTGLDHAEAGARIVAESTVLDELSDDRRTLVLDTIRHHNKGVLPGNLSPDTRLVLAVLRDADKLDAIRNNLRYLSPEQPRGKALKSGLTWDAEQVSPEAFRLAMNRELIPFRSIRWSNDFVLFLCCWIYDMGFHYTFNYLKKSGRYEELLARLPDSDRFQSLKAQLRDDLNWIGARSKGA